MQMFAASGSSIGWVVTQKCSLMYSDGPRQMRDLVLEALPVLVEPRASDGSQPKPHSISTIFRSGQRSKMPSMIMEVTMVCAPVACSVISSM